ncbi:MAG: YjbQ family protein [Candidatus Zambryskibacteria bacterium]|nr:YjbQ family protein [Candidatus Zambryskibacteria bacterium]
MTSQYKTHFETKVYQTKYRVHFIRITEDIEAVIERSGVSEGSVVVQTHHTTASLWVNEDEKNLIGPSEEMGYTADLRKILDSFASPMLDYGHNDIAHAENKGGKRNTHLCEPDEHGVIHECVNGHAHAQAMVLQSSITLIVHEGKLCKGKWQQVMLVELDHDRKRTVSFMVQGV